MATMIDCQRAVQACVDVDAGTAIAATAGARRELQQTPVEGDCVVMADRALVLKAADPLESLRRGGWLPGRLRMRGGLRKARIVPRQKPVEHPLGLGQRARLGKPQFDDEAILEGAEETLDSTLALRRGRGNPANPQFLEGTANLGRGHGAGQLIDQRQWRAGIAMKQAMAIGVGGGGYPIALDEAAEEEEVAMGIFLRAKDGSKDLSRGIIDGGQQDEPGATVLQPGVVTAVHLDQEAGLGHAFPAAAMPGRPAAARAAKASGAKDALDGGAGQVQRFVLGDQLC